MNDNRLRIAFDYKKPDEAALVVYKAYSGVYGFGPDAAISVVRTIVGKKAVALYSELSGKSIEEIEKEAENEP